jgi:hypothetical protein
VKGLKGRRVAEVGHATGAIGIGMQHQEADLAAGSGGVSRLLVQAERERIKAYGHERITRG